MNTVYQGLITRSLPALRIQLKSKLACPSALLPRLLQDLLPWTCIITTRLSRPAVLCTHSLKQHYRMDTIHFYSLFFFYLAGRLQIHPKVVIIFSPGIFASLAFSLFLRLSSAFFFSVTLPILFRGSRGSSHRLIWRPFVRAL